MGARSPIFFTLRTSLNIRINGQRADGSEPNENKPVSRFSARHDVMDRRAPERNW
jgi:hypothetical protein